MKGKNMKYFAITFRKFNKNKREPKPIKKEICITILLVIIILLANYFVFSDGLKKDKIDEIVLVGGSTRIPKIR
jgi:hypothetical protein